MDEDGALVSELATGLRSADPRIRDRSADEVTDVYRSFTHEQIAMIVDALVSARLVETDGAAQEAELHALAELAANGHELPMSMIDRLRSIIQPTGDPSQDEYLADLLRA